MSDELKELIQQRLDKAEQERRQIAKEKRGLADMLRLLMEKLATYPGTREGDQR